LFEDADAALRSCFFYWQHSFYKHSSFVASRWACFAFYLRHMALFLTLSAWRISEDCFHINADRMLRTSARAYVGHLVSRVILEFVGLSGYVVSSGTRLPALRWALLVRDLFMFPVRS
jgi:hypothetical protein